MGKFSYNLEKDITEGLIEVYSPNFINSKFDSYEHLKATAALHSMNPLEAANNMMSMYRLNYSRNNEIARERVEKWNAYYAVLKSRKKYKCKECGWKGKITEMALGIWEEHACPNCDQDLDLSI